MRARTKIVCTLGPATNSYEKILELIDVGMNVSRINMSHGTHEEHLKTINALKKARQERGVPLAIMLDTKGPEVRVGAIDGGSIALEKGQRLKVVKQGAKGDITLIPSSVIDDIDIGEAIIFDDGSIASKVVGREPGSLTVEIQNSGILQSHKGVNIPNVQLNFPAVTEQDKADIIFGCRNGIDILAASFIHNADHVLTIKGLLEEHEASDVIVLAKIESVLGVKNFDSILQVSDGIMVARGDLGVELPLTYVPKLQKMMIRKCYQSLKSVVTATQMLESMIHNPRPTRAEVSDVANAIYDSTTAVMLSGETAAGEYPIEAVRVMKETILETEKDFDYEAFFYKDIMHQTFNDVSSSVALAAVETAYSARGRALLALTTNGFTARIMARFRPDMPIIAVTSKEKTYHQLAFAWGTVPIYEKVKDVNEGIKKAGAYILEHKLGHYGDLIIVTSGTPFGVSGTTNMMVVDSIGDVLVRGMPGKGKKAHGEILPMRVFDPKRKHDVQGKLVLISHCNEASISYLKGAAGIILQNHVDDVRSQEHAERIAQDLNIPLLLCADNKACSTLRRGQVVTLDPVRGLIFDGIIDHKCDETCVRDGQV